MKIWISEKNKITGNDKRKFKKKRAFLFNLFTKQLTVQSTNSNKIVTVYCEIKIYVESEICDHNRLKARKEEMRVYY